MSEVQCPRCGKTVPGLQSIEGGLMAKLQEAGQTGLPNQVCGECFKELAGSVARGSVLLMQEKALEQHKLMLWKSRVGLVRTARVYMQEKAFSDAAVQYEKYLRILEVVFGVGRGELTPDQFRDSARTQELTIVASAYWDLMRIYDTSEKYGDRMSQAAAKLAIFLRFTPIYPDVMRKAEIFGRTAKNQSVMKNFLKTASDAKGPCFIATSAFESGFAPEVMQLRKWRDDSLLLTPAGQLFVQAYYRYSPMVARALNKVPLLKPLVRAILRLFINLAVRH